MQQLIYSVKFRTNNSFKCAMYCLASCCQRFISLSALFLMRNYSLNIQSRTPSCDVALFIFFHVIASSTSSVVNWIEFLLLDCWPKSGCICLNYLGALKCEDIQLLISSLISYSVIRMSLSDTIDPKIFLKGPLFQSKSFFFFLQFVPRKILFQNDLVFSGFNGTKTS